MARYGNNIERLLDYKFDIVDIPSGKNLLSDYISQMYDSTLFENAEGDPDQNLDKMHAGKICTLWSLPLVYNDIHKYQKDDKKLAEICSKLEQSRDDMGQYQLKTGCYI